MDFLLIKAFAAPVYSLTILFVEAEVVTESKVKDVGLLVSVAEIALVIADPGVVVVTLPIKDERYSTVVYELMVLASGVVLVVESTYVAASVDVMLVSRLEDVAGVEEASKTGSGEEVDTTKSVVVLEGLSFNDVLIVDSIAVSDVSVTVSGQ